MSDEIELGIDSDTVLPTPASAGQESLIVYQAGELTVIGFGNRDVPDEVCVARYRDALLRIIQEHRCQQLAFDLTGVRMMPSGMLGLLTTLRKQVNSIELYNASKDIRDTLTLTKLDRLFEIQSVDLPPAS